MINNNLQNYYLTNSVVNMFDIIIHTDILHDHDRDVI